MARFLSSSLVLAAVLFLAGCGTSGVQNAQLATSAVPKNKARIKITRTNDLLYIGAPASVLVNGKKVTDIAAGGTTYIDVPSGPANIAVYAWSYPGKFSLRINARPGSRHTVEISPREESFLPSATLGIIGGAIDASVNENAGAFKLRFVRRKRAKSS